MKASVTFRPVFTVGTMSKLRRMLWLVPAPVRAVPVVRVTTVLPGATEPAAGVRVSPKPLKDSAVPAASGRVRTTLPMT